MVKSVIEYPSLPWSDAWSTGQLKSKIWLLNELAKIQQSFSCIHVVGGWLGVLSWLLLNDDRFNIEAIRSFDIDPSCEQAADKLNINDKINGWKFKAITEDATNMFYSKDGYYDLVGIKSNGTFSKPRSEKPDCIINTSCDHFDNIEKWVNSLPVDSLIVLQNTDIKHDSTHVNCSENIDDFRNQIKFGNVIYSGTLDLGDYRRFMLIGKK